MRQPNEPEKSRPGAPPMFGLMPLRVGLRYLLLDPAVGEVVVEGQAEQAAEGQYTVTLPADVTGALFPGFYQLYLAAESDSLARITERRVDLEVVP